MKPPRRTLFSEVSSEVCHGKRADAGSRETASLCTNLVELGADMSTPPKPLGTFHAVRTRDAVAFARDGWPYFAMEPRGTDPKGEPLFEIRFGDGIWMLAVLADLSP